MKKHVLFLMLCILALPLTLAFQQSYLTFSLDSSWEPVEQRKAAQIFQKGNFLLEVRNADSDISDPDTFCKEKGCEVLSVDENEEYTEFIIKDEEYNYIFVRLAKADETYIISLRCPHKILKQAKAEMQKIYPTLDFSKTQKFVEAHWEQELKDPPKLPFFTRHRIPWGLLVFVLIISLVTYWFIWRRKKKVNGFTGKVKGFKKLSLKD